MCYTLHVVKSACNAGIKKDSLFTFDVTKPEQPGARKCPGWPGKITSSPEARNYFPKPGIIQQIVFLYG